MVRLNAERETHIELMIQLRSGTRIDLQEAGNLFHEIRIGRNNQVLIVVRYLWRNRQVSLLMLIMGWHTPCSVTRRAGMLVLGLSRNQTKQQ